jgi:hypothetical protein
MAHVILRDKPGRWGPPYGIRLIMDCIVIEDGGETVAVYDWKGQNPFFKPNDIQALLNFLALAHPNGLLAAWELAPTTVRWTGVGIPTLMRDETVFQVDQWEKYLTVLDDIQEEWQSRKQTREATPGKHCKDCKLNGTQQCPATKDAYAPVTLSAESPEVVAKWSDADLVAARELLKTRAGHIEALLEMVDPELKARAEQRIIGPPGQRYQVKEQGTAQITWDHDRMWALACKAAGLESTWALPRELAGLFGIVLGKGAMLEWLKARAGSNKELRNQYMEALEGCYEQGKSKVMRLVKCPENVPAVRDQLAKDLGYAQPPEVVKQISPATQVRTVTSGGVTAHIPEPRVPDPDAYAEALGAVEPDTDPNAGREAAVCRSCAAEIWWGETANGKKCPFDADGRSHFATCPQARQHSRKGKAGQQSLEGG